MRPQRAHEWQVLDTKLIIGQVQRGTRRPSTKGYPMAQFDRGWDHFPQVRVPKLMRKNVSAGGWVQKLALKNVSARGRDHFQQIWMQKVTRKNAFARSR